MRRHLIANMTARFQLRPVLTAGALACLLLVSGCGPGAMPRVIWPLPPEKPKIEFIGVYHSQNNFPKGVFRQLLDAVLGEETPAGFKSPWGVAADGKGLVYVSDLHDRNIRIYDFNKYEVKYFSEDPIFDQPRGLAIDRDGLLYVVDSGRKSVTVYDQNHKPTRSFGGADVLPKPSYIAVNDRNGRIYVSDSKRHEVVVFDKQGKYLFAFGGLGQGDGQFAFPVGIAINSKDEVYVADYFNARVEAFDASGKFLRAFGERGDLYSQFEQPRALAFDSEDNLWVADNRRGSIYTYTPDGTLLLVTGAESRSVHPLAFTNPTGMFIDQHDRIYVTDMMNKRFAVWQYLSDDYLKAHPITAEDMREIDSFIVKPAEEKAAPKD